MTGSGFGTYQSNKISFKIVSAIAKNGKEVTFYVPIAPLDLILDLITSDETRQREILGRYIVGLTEEMKADL